MEIIISNICSDFIGENISESLMNPTLILFSVINSQDDSILQK